MYVLSVHLHCSINLQTKTRGKWTNLSPELVQSNMASTCLNTPYNSCGHAQTILRLCVYVM